MPNPRIGYGCFVHTAARDKNAIYICGGILAKQQAVTTCDVYHVEKDEWEQLPDLPEPLYSLSVSVFNDFLLAVGGLNKNHAAVRQISRLDLKEKKVWEVHSVKLPKAMSNVGLH